MKLIQLIKPLVIFSLLMITTHSYSQSFYSLLETTPTETPVIRWYVDDEGLIRYDIPKLTFQQLENKAKKLIEVEKILVKEKALTQQVVNANINLQGELITLQKDIGNVKIEYSDLAKQYSLSQRDNDKLSDENEELEIDLGIANDKAAKYKSERNWAIVGIVVVTTAAFLGTR